jgi:hypothetical protein
MKMHKQAFLYLAKDREPPHKLEIDPGLKCFLEDLSDTGCAVTVGGKTEIGLRVKVQFALDNVPVCISGIVRSTTYKDDTNRSLLHVEADPLPTEIRNLILGQMFGKVSDDDDDDDLPFRVLDDEAAKISSASAPSGNDPFTAGGAAAQEKSSDSPFGGLKMEDFF